MPTLQIHVQRHTSCLLSLARGSEEACMHPQSRPLHAPGKPHTWLPKKGLAHSTSAPPLVAAGSGSAAPAGLVAAAAPPSPGPATPRAVSDSLCSITYFMRAGRASWSHASSAEGREGGERATPLPLGDPGSDGGSSRPAAGRAAVGMGSFAGGSAGAAAAVLKSGSGWKGVAGSADGTCCVGLDCWVGDGEDMSGSAGDRNSTGVGGTSDSAGQS